MQTGTNSTNILKDVQFDDLRLSQNFFTTKWCGVFGGTNCRQRLKSSDSEIFKPLPTCTRSLTLVGSVGSRYYSRDRRSSDGKWFNKEDNIQK